MSLMLLLVLKRKPAQFRAVKRQLDPSGDSTRAAIHPKRLFVPSVYSFNFEKSDNSSQLLKAAIRPQFNFQLLPL